MSWLELSVRVSRQNAPLVESLLQNEAVLALTLTDDADDPVLEPGVGETPLWPAVCVTALFKDDTPVEPLARMLSLVPGVDRPQQVNFRKFEDQQWERVWLDRFQPMQFGADLWIVPGDQQAPGEAKHVLRLDPGLAFGTGTHPTTRLCLQWMDGHDFNGQTVVDYGCGSGVLGIVAAIKGAAGVICVDNDPQALVATGDNASRNGVAESIHVLMPANFKPGSADVVLANILAGPLIELAPVLLTSLRPGGSLVLSGILEEQAEGVAKAYRNYFDQLTITTDDGWVRLHGQKSTRGLPTQGTPQ
jgi:ribosomal protein L11 methyltransferase